MSLVYYIFGADGYGKVVYINKPYVIKEDSKGYVIYNTDKDFDVGHGHINSIGAGEKLIKLIKRNIVPDSSYLRGTCLRICLDKKYLDKVQNKIDKDKNKTGYVNVNKGVRLR